jgi:ATP-dependent DNA helicase PIF1
MKIESLKTANHGFITGPAGSGKTYNIRKVIEENPEWGLLTATTGVAARNLGDNVPTVHSALGFYDLQSLRRLHEMGDLVLNMSEIAKHHRVIVIDEVSMMLAEMLEILTEASTQSGLGIILSGDFLQLPPVVTNIEETPKPHWAFHASCWDIHYAPNTCVLEKTHRQSNTHFIEGLRALRAGRGAAALNSFKRCGVQFTDTLDYRFPGTSIVATNRERESFNERMYRSLLTPEKRFTATRWGKQRREWKEIPEVVSLKVGAQVMILRNLYEKGDGTKKLLYANGDTGTVTDMDDGCVHVVRESDNRLLPVRYVDEDDSEIIGYKMETITDPITGKEETVKILEKTQPTGGVHYMPVAQAWAVTVHKAQGLSLDAVQVNLPERFYGSPAMVYVAASRCRTPEGLVLVGGEKFLAQRCTVDPDAKEWIMSLARAAGA